VDPDEFFKVSHGVRTRDNVRRFQTVPVAVQDLSEEELTATVDRLELEIANTAFELAAAGGRGITLLPGVGKLLGDLRGGGARWGLVTSATRAYADIALQAAGIVPPPLPFRITGNDCLHGKPHPEPFLHGLEALRKLPGTPIEDAHDVLVFEDAPSGLRAGLAAGCQTLAVCTSHTREIIEAEPATHKVLDLDRVEVVRCDGESITLRLKPLDQEAA